MSRRFLVELKICFEMRRIHNTMRIIKMEGLMEFPDWSDHSAAYKFMEPQVLKFIDAVKHLSATNEYKAECLCCEFWTFVPANQHSIIGDRLYEMVKGKILPLKFVRKASDRSLVYCLD